MPGFAIQSPTVVGCLCCAVLWLLSGCSEVEQVPAEAAAQSNLPNFVILLADDLGWRDVGYHGGDYPTPHIDRLARSGVRLENFYVQPLCSPTRAALLTGRYPIRYGLQSCALRPWAQAGLALTEQTLAAALGELGYTTAIVGKWHLGHFAPAYLPMARGFDHQYGPFNGGVNYVTHQRMGRLDWHRDQQPLEEEGYATTLLANEASRLIRQHDFSKPLFLYVPFTAVHSPRSAPASLVKRFRSLQPEARQIYAAMVASLDRAVGDVLATLEEVGVRDNTLVLFGSDNGGAPGMGDNGSLRGFKGELGEGAVRTSWIASWPGRLPEGVIRNEPVQVVDLFPTLLQLAGGTSQAGRLDGTSIFAVLAKGEARALDDLLIYSGPRGGALRSGALKLVIEKREKGAAPVVELFDLNDDPTEQHNLAQERSTDLERLQKRLKAWEALAVAPIALSATRPADFVPPEIWGQTE